MRFEIFSYRFAAEILQHDRYLQAWDEISTVLKETPLFIYPNKSKKNSRLEIVQQVLNTYFDRRLGVDLGWEYRPLATNIPDSNLRADFRKSFSDLSIQVEVQFGNMARWYTDIFKFQTAYSQRLTQVGLSIVATAGLARRIDSNVTHFERAVRELPSANLSITLPILLIGISPDERTPIVNLTPCRFGGIGEITGKGKTENQWRIVNGYLTNTPMEDIGPGSSTGPLPEKTPVDDENE